jgi:hypothetical protein
MLAVARGVPLPSPTMAATAAAVSFCRAGASLTNRTGTIQGGGGATAGAGGSGATSGTAGLDGLGGVAIIAGDLAIINDGISAGGFSRMSKLSRARPPSSARNRFSLGRI